MTPFEFKLFDADRPWSFIHACLDIVTLDAFGGSKSFPVFWLASRASIRHANYIQAS